MNKNSTLRKLTILHSNDIHGSFLPVERDHVLYGGAAKLYQYIDTVRSSEDTTLYLVAGDIFTGSALDSESDGRFSLDIMNKMKPDVITLGNHSADHGMGRVHFFEKLADFPVVNANIYAGNQRLFKPYQAIEKNGLKILVIGVVTEMLMDRKHKDPDLALLDVKDPYDEIASICQNFDEGKAEGEKLADFDLRIILSHIGFQDDMELAGKLDPAWRIDLIIGGHSHTYPDAFHVKNGVIIVQAGVKTKQIGRLDLVLDSSKRRIVEISNWDLIPLNSITIGKHPEMKTKVQTLDAKIDASIKQRYKIPANNILVTLPKTLLHEFRFAESTMGNFFADALKDEFNLDIAMVGSGSIREEELGPKVTFKALLQTFNLNKVYLKVCMKGKTFKKACEVYLQKAPYDKEDEGEYFQLSRGCEFHFDKTAGKLTKWNLNGKEIEEDKVYTVGLEEYHYKKLENRFDLKPDDLDGEPKVLTDFLFDTIRKHLEKNADRYNSSKEEEYNLEGRTLRV